MADFAGFKPLNAQTLPQRLGQLPALLDMAGGPAEQWQVREVGDGNLNLVFIVEGSAGTVIVKQALPYVRLVGDSWPLPLKRSFFEHKALTRQQERDPGSVPAILHFDGDQAIIVMEFLAPHVILRRAFVEGRPMPRAARDLGLFLARTLFRGSDLAMPPRERKEELAIFADNVELCDITENLVFSDPYFEAKLNRHTSPELDGIVAQLRSDRDVKVEAQVMKHIFANRNETLLHGDLHTGSVMVTDTETRVIDPEFAFYGPMAFDVGILLSNFWMSYFSQSGHGERAEMQSYLLTAVEEIWTTFRAEFSHLWRTERNGILYQRTLFEDQGDFLGSEQALSHVLADIWTDALGFAGCEMHRRILGLAHNLDFEAIVDTGIRARCETKALKLGRQLLVGRRHIHTVGEVNDLAEQLEKEIVT